MVAVLLYLSLLTPVFATWSLASSALTAPRARRAHAAAWDAVERRWWLHGGRGEETLLEDLWIWDADAEAWLLAQGSSPAASAPAAREEHALRWDGLQLWMFGGFDGENYVKDLWSYSGTSWSLVVSTTTGPSARGGHVLLSSNATLWIHGGYDGLYRQDLWHFDTASGLWMHYGAASGAPAARAYHGAAYDDVEEAIWIHGGYDGSFYYRDLWQYLTASNTWTLVSSVTGSPSARAYHGMTWAEESLWLQGGFNGQLPLGDLWRFDRLGRWQLLDACGPERYGHVAGWDLRSRSLWMHGGQGADGLTGELWQFQAPGATVCSSTVSSSISTSGSTATTTSSTSTATNSSTAAMLTFAFWSVEEDEFCLLVVLASIAGVALCGCLVFCSLWWLGCRRPSKRRSIMPVVPGSMVERPAPPTIPAIPGIPAIMMLPEPPLVQPAGCQEPPARHLHPMPPPPKPCELECIDAESQVTEIADGHTPQQLQAAPHSAWSAHMPYRNSSCTVQLLGSDIARSPGCRQRTPDFVSWPMSCGRQVPQPLLFSPQSPRRGENHADPIRSEPLPVVGGPMTPQQPLEVERPPCLPTPGPTFDCPGRDLRQAPLPELLAAPRELRWAPGGRAGARWPVPPMDVHLNTLKPRVPVHRKPMLIPASRQSHPRREIPSLKRLELALDFATGRPCHPLGVERSQQLPKPPVTPATAEWVEEVVEIHHHPHAPHDFPATPSCLLRSATAPRHGLMLANEQSQLLTALALEAPPSPCCAHGDPGHFSHHPERSRRICVCHCVPGARAGHICQDGLDGLVHPPEDAGHAAGRLPAMSELCDGPRDDGAGAGPVPAPGPPPRPAAAGYVTTPLGGPWHIPGQRVRNLRQCTTPGPGWYTPVDLRALPPSAPTQPHPARRPKRRARSVGTFGSARRAELWSVERPVRGA